MAKTVGFAPEPAAADRAVIQRSPRADRVAPLRGAASAAGLLANRNEEVVLPIHGRDGPRGALARRAQWNPIGIVDGSSRRVRGSAVPGRSRDQAVIGEGEARAS